MQAGDQVVFVHHPALYGIGTIESPAANGLLLVEFDGQLDVFHPQELEVLEVWLREPIEA